MPTCREIVDLVRLDRGEDRGQGLRVAEITVMKTEVAFADRVLPQVINARAVEGRRPADYTVHLVPPVE